MQNFFVFTLLFYHTSQKNVLQKEVKDWTFEVDLWTGEPSSWFQLIESLKWYVSQILCVVLEFFVKQWGFEFFFAA